MFSFERGKFFGKGDVKMSLLDVTKFSNSHYTRTGREECRSAQSFVFVLFLVWNRLHCKWKSGWIVWFSFFRLSLRISPPSWSPDEFLFVIVFAWKIVWENFDKGLAKFKNNFAAESIFFFKSLRFGNYCFYLTFRFVFGLLSFFDFEE